MHLFQKITSIENLFKSWEEFKRGKTGRNDVQAFETQLEQHVFQLHRDLRSKSYQHGPYQSFTICDPKQRCIHKASVRDRLVHHAIFRILNPVFDPLFIAHSFSCRKDKGTHKAVDALEDMLRQVSCNHTQLCFALKCDISKFFDSIDHTVLLKLLFKKVHDEDTQWLLRNVVESFSARFSTLRRAGLPIGNLTSQIFANVYMNAFDQFVKHELRARYYVR